MTKFDIMSKTKTTRSTDTVWLLGFPCENISGARLPSGLDVMRNFLFYHRTRKLSISKSAKCVYDQLVPFWVKSRLPIIQQKHIITKIIALYNEHVHLMKHRKRSNENDKVKQGMYTTRLQQLFDISPANANEMISNDEDRVFLRLQQQSRTGSIGPVDKKLADREKRAKERTKRFAKQVAVAVAEKQVPNTVAVSVSSESSEEDDKEEESGDEVVVRKNKRCAQHPKRARIVTSTVAAVLDRTNTSVRKSAMILASAVNEAGCSVSSVVLSKSSVHRHRQQLRKVSAREIQSTYRASKCVVHWDSKLLPEVTGEGDVVVDRLPILVTSLVDGCTKLLGVPKLTCGSGLETSKSVVQYLEEWNIKSHVIGMCFDTTASNTGKWKGACTLVERAVGHDLLWLACRHHMFEVLLSDAFTQCFGSSTAPEIILFKKFREIWPKLCHEPKVQEAPRIPVSDAVKAFIVAQLDVDHPRDDYRELISLSALLVGVDVGRNIRKPGAVHRARWMAKAIYSMKMELLYDVNKATLCLTASELKGLQRFNRFIVRIYIQSWFTSRSAPDAPVNDISLIQRLQDYDDECLKTVGLNMMKRQSWYLSQELAALALFSDQVTAAQKMQMLETMVPERGPHKLDSLPNSVSDLIVSRTFFNTAGINDSFLDQPVETWPESTVFCEATSFIKNLPCVNDCAERGVSLIETFNTAVKDEEQKQFMLQVVEKHRKQFVKCNREDLLSM